MTFVGIITDIKNEIKLKNLLSSKNGEGEFCIFKENSIIVINEDTIDNVKNVQFEALLIMVDYQKRIKNIRALNKILSNVKYLIVNSDENMEFELKSNINLILVTYGFNFKSTITASSVSEEEIFLCIQRTIKSIENTQFEMQELKVKKLEGLSDSEIIGVSTLYLLYDRIGILTKK